MPATEMLTKFPKYACQSKHNNCTMALALADLHQHLLAIVVDMSIKRFLKTISKQCVVGKYIDNIMNQCIIIMYLSLKIKFSTIIMLH